MSGGNQGRGGLWLSVLLLFSGCATRQVSCDGPLRAINTGAAPEPAPMPAGTAPGGIRP